jgi:hypothetical protein
MSPGPHKDGDAFESGDLVVIVAEAMLAAFGDRAEQVAAHQLAMAGRERPDVADRWRAIASALDGLTPKS